MTTELETISFDVSPDLLASLKVGATTLGEQIRLLAAVTYFQEKRLSLGKAAELSGLNRLDFMDILVSKNITVFDYDASEVAVELEGIKKLPHDCQ